MFSTLEQEAPQKIFSKVVRRIFREFSVKVHPDFTFASKNWRRQFDSRGC